MNLAFDRPTPMRHNGSNPLIWVPSLLYLALLATGLYFHGMGLCAPGIGMGQLALFGGALLFLLGLEQYASRRSSSQSRQRAVALLLVRLAVFAVIAAVDCSHLSRALFVLLPFVAYMSLGRRASYVLAAACLLIFIGQLWASIPAWYIE